MRIFPQFLRRTLVCAEQVVQQKLVMSEGVTALCQPSPLGCEVRFGGGNLLVLDFWIFVENVAGGCDCFGLPDVNTFVSIVKDNTICAGNKNQLLLLSTCRTSAEGGKLIKDPYNEGQLLLLMFKSKTTTGDNVPSMRMKQTNILGWRTGWMS